MKCIISFLAFIAGFHFITACAQTSAPSNAYNNIPQAASGWRPYSTVTVYIDSNIFPFGSAATQAIMQGFFNDAIAYSSQSVSYSFESVVNQPSPATNQVYVTAGYFTNSAQFGSNQYNYKFDGATGLNDVLNSTIYLSSSIVSSPNALTYVTAHEESHDNFLGDCPNCDGNSTIMTYQNNVFSPPFEGPTGADIDASAFFGDIGGGGQGICPTRDFCYAPS